MFVNSIFTLTLGLISVYVRLDNPHQSLWGLFLWPDLSGQQLLSLKSYIYIERAEENCCRSSNFSDTSTTSTQKYLLYKVACFSCRPAQWVPLGEICFSPLM